MSKVNIQNFETRPEPVEAVQWDGTKKSARAIVDYLAGHKVKASYVEQYSGTAKADVVVPEADVALMVSDSDSGTRYMSPGWWIVRHPNDLFVINNPEKFEETYRVQKENS